MQPLNGFARNFSLAPLNFVFQHNPENPKENPKSQGKREEVSPEQAGRDTVDAGNKKLERMQPELPNLKWEIADDVSINDRLDKPNFVKQLADVLASKGYAENVNVKISQTIDGPNKTLKSVCIYINDEFIGGLSARNGFEVAFNESLHQIPTAPRERKKANSEADFTNLFKKQSPLPKKIDSDEHRRLLARELFLKNYPIDSILVIKTEKVRDEHFVLIYIDNFDAIKGGHYNWDDAFRNAIRKIPNSDELR